MLPRNWVVLPKLQLVCLSAGIFLRYVKITCVRGALQLYDDCACLGHLIFLTRYDNTITRKLTTAIVCVKCVTIQNRFPLTNNVVFQITSRANCDVLLG